MNNKSSFLIILILYCETVCTQAHDILVVDFVESMLNVAKYTYAGIKTDLTVEHLSDWQSFYALYKKYIVTDRVYAPHPRIPKIIHHIWLGSPLPERCKQFMETWKKNHPTWLFVLWDDARVAQLQLVNQVHYNAAINYGEKSDIARYEILYRFGGLYIDTDFECLQPFDALHHCCDFYVGATVNSGGGTCHVFNGLLGSRAGHSVLQRCIEGISLQSMHRPNVPAAIIDRTGPLYLTRCLKEAIADGKDIGRCVPFPPTYFYAWPGAWRFSKDLQFIRSFICPESLALHHWATSWV